MKKLNYIFAAVLLIILLFSIFSLNSSIQRSSEFDKQPSSSFETSVQDGYDAPHIGYLNPPDLNQDENDRCEACHESFEPFEVAFELPADFQPQQFSEYRIMVTNENDDPEHTVDDLEAMLTGLGGKTREPYHNSLSGSLRRFQADTFTFSIEIDALNADIVLTGSAGVSNLNNIDLIVRGPSGEWTSRGSGVDEQIFLDHDDIERGGIGDYEIEIQYMNGVGPISYTITIDVNYFIPDYFQSGENLETGDSELFTWNLALTQEQANNMAGVVSGTVSYLHDDGELVTYRYSIEVQPDSVSFSSSESVKNRNLEIGRILGLFSLSILVVVLITSYSRTSRKILAKPFKLKNPRYVHCFLAASILFFALIHANLLIRSHYSYEAKPVILGIIAFALFAYLAVEGFLRKRLISLIGRKKWRLMHIIIALSAVILVLYKAITYGGHFFG